MEVMKHIVIIRTVSNVSTDYEVLQHFVYNLQLLITVVIDINIPSTEKECM